MDWASVWLDIVIGLVTAGLISALLPESFWSAFFLADHPLAAKIVYTTVLEIIALIVSAVLVWRFMRTGGPEMLAAMESPDGHDYASHAHGHAHHHHRG